VAIISSVGNENTRSRAMKRTVARSILTMPCFAMLPYALNAIKTIFIAMGRLIERFIKSP